MFFSWIICGLNKIISNCGFRTWPHCWLFFFILLFDFLLFYFSFLCRCRDTAGFSALLYAFQLIHLIFVSVSKLSKQIFHKSKVISSLDRRFTKLLTSIYLLCFEHLYCAVLCFVAQMWLLIFFILFYKSTFCDRECHVQ